MPRTMANEIATLWRGQRNATQIVRFIRVARSLLPPCRVRPIAAEVRVLPKTFTIDYPSPLQEHGFIEKIPVSEEFPCNYWYWFCRSAQNNKNNICSKLKTPSARPNVIMETANRLDRAQAISA